MGWADAREDGVRRYAPDGDLIGRINLPETAQTFVLAARSGTAFFMAASTSIYAVYVDVQGAQIP
jgi:gluconolactonase